MSYLDDCTIYIFMRADLSEEDQVVQSNHAIFEMAVLLTPGEGRPSIVALDGGSSEKAFAKTLRKIREKQIAHVAYTDPDQPHLGITAIATGPLTKEQSLPLANYRLRRYSPVAQTVEQREPLRGSAEVEGAIPSGRAMLP